MAYMQYLGEIRLLAFDYAPRDWKPCDGRLLRIADYGALFALVGTAYGGDGTSTFGLPDLRGAAAVHRGTFQQGERGGLPSVTVHWRNTPPVPHTHALQASTDAADNLPARGMVLATTEASIYTSYLDDKGAERPRVTLPATSVTSVGGAQPHENMPPYQAVTFCIATFGINPPKP
jgi:microcystin-dependent protein